MSINNDLEIGHRPWGRYEVLSEKEGYKVKRIIVLPKGKLSLQLHQYRSEHWIVVAGEAKVTNGEKTLILTVNQSSYIPKQTKHRLENTTDHELVIIETQLGSYLGEDDIVRFEDIYDRIDQKT